MAVLKAFLGKVVTLILVPLGLFLFALALFFFVWGASTFILKADDAKARDTGKQHLIWGLVGMFIMIAAIPIISIITNTFCGTPFCVR
jgi:hypothetical protein